MNNFIVNDCIKLGFGLMLLHAAPADNILVGGSGGDIGKIDRTHNQEIQIKEWKKWKQ